MSSYYDFGVSGEEGCTFTKELFRRMDSTKRGLSMAEVGSRHFYDAGSRELEVGGALKPVATAFVELILDVTHVMLVLVGIRTVWVALSK